VKHGSEDFLFPEDMISNITYPQYMGVFFNKLNQLNALHVNYSFREKRGLQLDHVSLNDQVGSEDSGVFSLEEILDSYSDSPEAIIGFDEMKKSVYQDLSSHAQRYFDAVGYLPAGNIESWSKPLKMYVREVLQARAELYRTYNSKIRGFDPSIVTDEIVEGLTDPSGAVKHVPAQVSAEVLKR
jgi:hypothetical protein